MNDAAQVAFERGKARFDAEETAEAEREFSEAVRLEPDNAAYHAWLARVYATQMNHARAAEEVTRALQLDPNCAMAHFVRGREATSPEEQIVHYSRAIELDPKYSQAYNNRGIAFRVQKDCARAIQDYTRATELDPKYSQAYNNRGDAFYDQKDYARAVQDFTRAIELDPKYAWAYNARGNAFYVQQDYARAIQDYTRAIELDPGNAHAYYWRGVSFSNGQEYACAIPDYTRAVELDPDYADAYSSRDDAYAAVGDLENSIADRARYFGFRVPGRYTSTDVDNDSAFVAIDSHLTQHLLPEVKQAGERLVAHFPCCLRWGQSTSQSWYQGTSSYVHRARYGVGHVSMTEKGLYLISLGEPSQRLLRDRGLLQKALFAFLRNFDFSGVEKQDRFWVTPYTSVLGVQAVEDDIQLTTAQETWTITPFVQEDQLRILTAIGMGRTGKLEHIWDRPKPAPVAPASSSAEVLKLLEQLGELKAKGILTEAEFEEKKKKLLAQL